MANAFQVTFDAASPRALGAFWCEVLGYVEQPPPEGFDTWEEALDAAGIDRSHLDVHAGVEELRPRAEELVALGAARSTLRSAFGP